MSRIIVAILLIILSPHLIAANLTKVSLNDETYMIVDVRLQSKIKVVAGIEVFVHQGEYLLPLFAFTNALQMDSTINVEKSNFSLSFNDNQSDIDFATNQIDSSVEFDSNIVFWGENGFDIYVSQPFLEQLIEAQISPEISNLIFNIIPKNSKLLYPIEIALQREANLDNRILNSSKAVEIDLGQVFIEDQYRLIMPPQLYTRIRYNKYSDIVIPTTQNDVIDLDSESSTFTDESAVSVTGTSDVLYHSARYSVNWDDRSKVSSTIQFAKYKTSPYDMLPGNVDYYAFGDISSYASSLTKQNNGVGLTFSQKEDRYSYEFGKTTIDGIAPPGWQVELYDGGFFIGETIVNEDGLYTFNEVNTRYGENQYRMVLYGPYGEVETRYETVRIGSNWLNTGEISYRGAFFDSKRKLLDSEQYKEQGLDYRVDALNFGFDYGLSDSIQLQFMYHQDEDELSEIQRYVSTQTQINFDSNAVTIGVASKENAGFASELTWYGNLSNLDTFGFNIQYADDYDLVFGVNDRAILQGAASYHSQFREFGNSMLDLYSKYTKVDQQYESTTYNGRFSWNMLGLNMKFYLTNTRFSSLSANMFDSSNSRATIAAAGPVADGRLTASLVRQLDNSTYYQYNINYQRNFDSVFLYSNAKYTRTELDKEEWESNVQLAYRSRHALLTAGVAYNTKSEWRLTLGLDFAFGYDYQRKEFDFTSHYNQSAKFDIGAYLDRNNNYILDQGDYALEGVEFGPLSRWAELPSLKNGRSLLTHVPSKHVVGVDAKWRDVVRPSEGKHKVYSHPGGLISADIPFTITTTMAGYVLFDNNDEKTGITGINGVTVNLIDLVTNKTVEQVTSDVDGFFEFYNRKPGHYWIEIELNDVSKRGLTVGHRRFELITPKRGGYVEVGSFILHSEIEQNDKTILVEYNEQNYEPLFTGNDELDKEIYVTFDGVETTSMLEQRASLEPKQVDTNGQIIRRATIKLVADPPPAPTNAFTRLEWRYGVQVGVFSSANAAQGFINTLSIKDVAIKAYFDKDNKVYRLILGELMTNINDIENSLQRYKPILPKIDMFVKYFRTDISY